MFREIRKQTVRVVKQHDYAGSQIYSVLSADGFLGTISVDGPRFEVQSKECIGEALDFSDALNMLLVLNIEEPQELIPDPITGLIF